MVFCEFTFLLSKAEDVHDFTWVLIGSRIVERRVIECKSGVDGGVPIWTQGSIKYIHDTTWIIAGVGEINIKICQIQ